MVVVAVVLVVLSVAGLEDGGGKGGGGVGVVAADVALVQFCVDVAVFSFQAVCPQNTPLGRSATSGVLFSHQVQARICLCYRMVNPDLDGLEGKWDKDSALSKDEQLKIPTDSRLYAVQVMCNSCLFPFCLFCCRRALDCSTWPSLVIFYNTRRLFIMMYPGTRYAI